MKVKPSSKKLFLTGEETLNMSHFERNRNAPNNLKTEIITNLQ